MKPNSAKQTLAAVLFVVALNCATALPNFDPFADATGSGGTAYTVGAPLVPNTSTNSDGGLNVWVLVNSNVIATNPQPMVVAGNLSYTGLPASTGNSVSNSPPLAGTGASARMSLNVGSAPSLVYYSLVLKVTDLSAVPSSAAANAIAGFSDSAAAQATAVQRLGGRLVMTNNGTGTGYHLGIGKGSTTADYRYDPTEHTLGEEVFVVVSYERAGGATNVNLWVNPASSSLGVEPAPTPTASVPQGASAGDMNNSSITAFVLSCQAATIPSCIIDEVRVATNWARVTGGNPVFPVSITSQPASRNVKAGDRVAFVVAANGTAPTYTWRHNDLDIPGATQAAYPISSAATGDAGTYSVVVSNTMNSLTSAPAILNVSTTPLQLYETNLVIVRVGDGAQALTTSGNSVFLDQYTTNGTYVNTVFIPDTGASALIESGPDLSGSVLTGAALSRSANKRLMTLSGYNVALGNATALQNTYSTNVPRGIVTINSASQITLAVADTNAYSGAHFRGAATDGTNNFWGSGGTEGTWYLGFGSASNIIQSTFPNTRSVDIFNGNLYTLASATMNGLLKFNGLPTTDQGVVPNILSMFNSTTTTDFAVDPTDSFLYVTAGSTVQKWAYDGSILGFTNAYTLTGGFTEQARYLAADFSGAAPVLYVTTAVNASGGNRLMCLVDTNNTATAFTLASSGPNQLFKGVRFGPSLSPAPPSLGFSVSGSNLTLTWTGPFTLICSTNVAGPYSDVAPAATSPFTTNMLSPSAQFFGLRQN